MTHHATPRHTNPRQAKSVQANPGKAKAAQAKPGKAKPAKPSRGEQSQANIDIIIPFQIVMLKLECIP